MSFVKNLIHIFIFIILAQPAFATKNTQIISDGPKEIYGSAKDNIQIRISNGSAGSTGIFRVLAEDYLRLKGKKFSIAWYRNISVNSLKQLKSGAIDIALICEKSQGEAAQKEGYATHYAPVFNDHFLIIGPKSNPAKLDKSDSIQEIFLKISSFGERSAAPIFLSRNDNSSANVKEQFVWSSVGLKPWKTNAKWYAKYPVFPLDALAYTNDNSLYSITDWGTWLSNKNATSALEIYSQGGKTLFNPCFALLGKNPSQEALEFLNYLRSDRAQKLITDFGKDKYGGMALFTTSQQLDF